MVENIGQPTIAREMNVFKIKYVVFIEVKKIVIILYVNDGEPRHFQPFGILLKGFYFKIFYIKRKIFKISVVYTIYSVKYLT